VFGKSYDLELRALRTPQYKAIVSMPAPGRDAPRGVVYDLDADPGEQRPVDADRPDLARTAARQLDEMMTWSADYARRLPQRAGDEVPPDLEPIRDRLRALGYLDGG